MSVLEKLAKEVMEKKGLEYYMAYQVLHRYIHTTPIEQLKKDIAKIKDPFIIPTLYSAGLTFELQMELTKRWRELTK